MLVGFKSGVALVLASTQLPKLCGVPGGHGSFWGRPHPSSCISANRIPPPSRSGSAALAVLVAGKLWIPTFPVSLLVVAAGIAAVPLLGLAERGVALLGPVPQGLPSLGLPAVQRQDLNALLPLAMACFLLGAVETTAIGRMFAPKHRYRLDGNQEFLALGAPTSAPHSGMASR